MKYIIATLTAALLGFVAGRVFQKGNQTPPVIVRIMASNARARIDLIGSNGSQFADITIKPGRSVDWYGIDQISMLAFTTNRDDGSVFIHDWKRTNFGIRIWPGRN